MNELNLVKGNKRRFYKYVRNNALYANRIKSRPVIYMFDASVGPILQS